MKKSRVFRVTVLFFAMLFSLFVTPAWGTNASNTPAPGTVPISNSGNNFIKPGWIPSNYLTLTQNSATPAVVNYPSTYVTNNTNPTTYTNFTGASTGEQLTIIVGENPSKTSVQLGTNILGELGNTSTIALSYGDTFQIAYDGTYWHYNGPVSQTPPAYRNRIINGEMRIDARHAGTSQTVGTGDTGDTLYRVDRWAATATGANITAQQAAGSGQWKNYLQLSGAISNTGFTVYQRIESINIYDQASQTVTLSAYVQSSSLTSLTWAAYTCNGSDTCASAETLVPGGTGTGTWTITSSLTRYTATINLPAGATNGVEIRFTGGNLLNGQTFSITGVQFEPGSLATAFERRPDDLEYLRCFRYCPSWRNYGTGNISTAQTCFGTGTFTSTTAASMVLSIPVALRAAPSVTPSVVQNFVGLNTVFDLYSGSFFAPSGTSVGQWNGVPIINFTVAGATASHFAVGILPFTTSYMYLTGYEL